MAGFKHFFSPLIIDSPELHVRGIGLHEPMPACRIVRAQGTPDYLFMIFHHPVVLVVDGVAQQAGPGDMIAWPPSVLQDYGCATDGWEHTWLHCTGDRVRSAVSAAHFPLHRLFAHPHPKRWVDGLCSLYEEIVSGQADPVIAGNLIENALRDAVRPQGRAPSALATVPPAFLDLRNKLEREPQQQVRLAELASAMHLSAPHFSAQWKRFFGISPIEDVIRMRIEYAKYLLLDQNRRVADVSREVGIDDPYRFSKLFRRRVGVSPHQFRTKLRAAGP
jgi:AraC family transcriptional regulator of arabinose operon